MGAEVRPEVAEAVGCDRKKTCVRCCMSKRRLPEQGGMNCLSEFDPILGRGGFHVHAGEELIPGHGRFHVRAGGSKSRPVVRATALTGRTQASIYVP